MSQGNLYINGAWSPAHGAVWNKLDPVTQQPIWQGAEATADEVAQACQSARAAFVAWARRPLAERLEIIQRFATLLEQNKQQLATVISRETSKPLWETLTEVQSMVAKVAISVRAYHERTGESLTEMADGAASLRHRPHGVLAVSGPIIPALIAGNTVVFKPSELTPWTAEETVKLWQAAGLPDGVLNLVQGGRSTGEALAQSSEIDGLLFTGSANTGYHLHQQLAGAPE